MDIDRMSEARRIYLGTGSIGEVGRQLGITRQGAAWLLKSAGKNAPLAVTVTVRTPQGLSTEDQQLIAAYLRDKLEAAAITVLRTP